MNNTKVLSVDFNKKMNKLKSACAVTGGPRRGGVGLPLDLSVLYRELLPPAIRLADIEAPYGTNRFLDVHCIFPDFSADESLEDSYDFAPTDEYLTASLNIGSELFIRLGETPDPFPSPRYAFPKCSFKKWARICERIIMHYNEGWANGYKLGLKNFERWSFADEPNSWSGTPSEYYEFYSVVARHLHKRFPRLKLGAFGSGGFASLNRIDVSEEQKRYSSFLVGFLKYVTAKENSAPLDFLSWRCAALTPEEIAVHSRYARSVLDEYGQRRCKSVICELTLDPRLTHGSSDEVFSAAAAALTVAMKCEADLVFTNTLDGDFGGLFKLAEDGEVRRCANYYAYLYSSRLSRMASRLETTGDSRGELYSVAAADEGEAGLLIVSRNFSGRIELRFSGFTYSSVSVTRVTASGEVRTKDNIPLSGNKIAISAEFNEVFYLHFH